MEISDKQQLFTHYIQQLYKNIKELKLKHPK